MSENKPVNLEMPKFLDVPDKILPMLLRFNEFRYFLLDGGRGSIISGDTCTIKAGAGYNNAIIASSSASIETGVTNGFMGGTAGACKVGGDQCAVIASYDCIVNTGGTYTETAIIASRSCIATNYRVFIAASYKCQSWYSDTVVLASQSTGSSYGIANRNMSAIIATLDANTGGTRSAVIACNRAATLSGTDCVLTLASRATNSKNSYSVCGGYGVISGYPSYSNRTWELRSTTGNLNLSGTVLGAPSDYGEYFENLILGTIPLGTIVTLDGKKVKIANKGDFILGVISATAGIALGDSPFAWQGRNLKGEFGETLYDTIPNPDYEGEGEAPLITVPKINPDWDPEQEQIPRSERPEEWSLVGIIGQVHVRYKGSINVGDYLNAGGSKADNKTKLLVMKIKSPYSEDKGYGVAYCLLLN